MQKPCIFESVPYLMAKIRTKAHSVITRHFIYVAYSHSTFIAIYAPHIFISRPYDKLRIRKNDVLLLDKKLNNQLLKHLPYEMVYKNR